MLTNWPVMKYNKKIYAYMSLGIVLIMLGAILPDLKADYALS